jgi:hypothetical protein
MATILRKLPFFDSFTTAEVQGQAHRIFPLEIVVWVSLSPQGMRDLDPRTPRFPAVFDPGFSDAFLIHPQHLRRFAGLRPEHFRRLPDSLRSHERVIPLHAANLWLHPNRPGERDTFTGAPPILVELHRGIGITTDEELYPRLPLLGARALRNAGLEVRIDYSRCQLMVRTARRFWFFG